MFAKDFREDDKEINLCPTCFGLFWLAFCCSFFHNFFLPLSFLSPICSVCIFPFSIWYMIDCNNHLLKVDGDTVYAFWPVANATLGQLWLKMHFFYLTCAAHKRDRTSISPRHGYTTHTHTHTNTLGPCNGSKSFHKCLIN